MRLRSWAVDEKAAKINTRRCRSAFISIDIADYKRAYGLPLHILGVASARGKNIHSRVQARERIFSNEDIDRSRECHGNRTQSLAGGTAVRPFFIWSQNGGCRRISRTTRSDLCRTIGFIDDNVVGGLGLDSGS